MAYLSYIVSIIAIVLAGIFAILQTLWAGFAYFVLAMLLLLSLFWAGWLIYKYFTDYKKELEERFKVYRIETINANQIFADDFDRDETAFRKEFSKKVLKEKIFKWCMIAFCFACGVAFLMGMIFYA